MCFFMNTIICFFSIAQYFLYNNPISTFQFSPILSVHNCNLIIAKNRQLCQYFNLVVNLYIANYIF